VRSCSWFAKATSTKERSKATFPASSPSISNGCARLFPATEASLARDPAPAPRPSFASSDFGVMRLAKNAASWTLAGTGMPAVEAASLTISPAGRVVYAASHGLAAWRLVLR
jgi:hypothetical protein